MNPSLDNPWDNRVTCRRRRAVNGLIGCLIAWQAVFPVFLVVDDARAQPANPTASSMSHIIGDVAPLRLSCERLEFDHETEEVRAMDSVTVTRGDTRLTADRATIHKLSGRLTAKGRVRVRSQVADVWADELSVNVHTESGTMKNGSIFLKDTNTWIHGRLFRRFSETHYRVRDGTLTNCDSGDGRVPDWSVSFQDVDVERGDHVFAKHVWLNIRNYPIVPLPFVRYPTPGARQTGLLFPTTGIDNVFGLQYRQGWYWAMSPSQDLTITPQVLSKRGQGGEVGYRYVLNRRARGQWLLNTFHDTREDRVRAHITGAHVQHVHDDLLVYADVNYATDRTFVRDLSASGILRALPSQESVLHVTRRLPGGRVYLKAQYLQPLESGGRETFQRLPEIGHRYRMPLVWGRGDVTFDVGVDSTFVHFLRERGDSVSRVDIMPTVSVEGWHLGHMVSLRPRFAVREVLYSRGRTRSVVHDRGTLWVGVEAASNVSRAFAVHTRQFRHTIEPRLFYEYVPPSGQADVFRIDGIDYLPKKHLVTYSVNTGVQDERSGHPSATIAAFEIAQSYHLDGARDRTSAWSNLWARASLNMPATSLPTALSRFRLNVDAFYDPTRRAFAQLNAAVVVQAHRRAYVDAGYRRTRAGTAPRRGDVWNPLSLSETVVVDSDIHFFTPSAAVRLSRGWTVGARAWHDIATGRTPEWDVVGLYQNPCKCWSLGVYYIQLAGDDDLPERRQVNFVLTLRGMGSTTGFGAQILRSIVGPLFEEGESDLPWSSP